MNRGNIKFATKRQFDIVLAKEGITLTDYFDKSITYRVFFRKSNRGTNPQGKVRIFYSQDTPISIGTTFILKDGIYIVTSQDGVESDVYYTSLATKCDTTFNIYSEKEKKYIDVPFVVVSDKWTVTHGSVVSMATGSVAMFTKDCTLSRNIQINSEYYGFGGYYKVGNTFYNNGLAYVYMERTTTPQKDKYTLTYAGETTIDRTENPTYQLVLTAKKNDVVVDSPALTYVSSDESVATVDETGLMTLLTNGSTTITASWTNNEEVTTCSVDFNIIGESAAYTIRIDNSTDTIKVGGSYKSLSCKFYDGDDAEITDTVIVDLTREDIKWTCEIDGVDYTDNTDVITWLNGSAINQMKIKFANDRSYLTKVLDVKCTVNGITATKSFTITA